MIGYGQAVHPKALHVRHQIVDPDGAIQEGVFAVSMEMNERHGGRQAIGAGRDCQNSLLYLNLHPMPRSPVKGVFGLVSGLLLSGVLAGCGSTGPNAELGTPSESCANQAVTTLSVGEHVVINPATTSGCLRLPAAGTTAEQYLMVLASTNGSRSSNGNLGPFVFQAGRPTVANPSVEPVLAPSIQRAPSAGESLGLLPWRRSPAAIEFDATLRYREGELLNDPRYQRPVLRAPSLAPGLAPPLGDVRTFKACASLQCTSFTSVTATARYLGTNVAIYLDNNAPTADPLTDADLAELGSAFDRFHYPIDTTSFGRESDIDGNGVVLILMTKAVNDLTPDCKDGRVVGFFYGGDLLTGANSNRAEIFYTLVPSPATGSCTAVSRRSALNNLKPTLIHEFQHMISFNQHSLVRTGLTEDVWLNESLSHFAEELGGRLVPNVECVAAGFPSCRSQYASGDLLNGYDFLKDPGAHYMVFPNNTPGTLEERGAAWMFLRWLLDQFAADTIVGIDLTRALDNTSNTGFANVQSASGGIFATMVPEWLMAIYLDDGPDLPEESTGRLRYKSWGFRDVWTNPANAQIFPAGFPLAPIPISAVTGVTTKSDTLRAGSGYYFLLSQPANASGLDIRVVANTGGAALDPQLQARFGLVRIR